MRILFSFLLFTFYFASTAQIPSYVPTNGLVGWWPFNGNANDESGNGNNGSFTGLSCETCGMVVAPPIITTDRYGNNNTAYQFFSDFDFISISNSTSLQITQSFTISVWLNPNLGIYGQGPSYLSVLQKWGGTGSGASYMIALNTSGVPILYTNNAVATSSLVGTISLSLNQWTHLVYTFNNGLATLYTNGLFTTSASNIVTPSIGNSSIEIARNLNQFANFSGDAFSGKVDDIAIFNRALTQNEITQLYTNTVTPYTNEDTTSNVGIGTTNPKRKLHVYDVMRLEPRNSEPANPAKGDIYFDGVLNKLRVYDGTVWQNCW